MLRHAAVAALTLALAALRPCGAETAAPTDLVVVEPPSGVTPLPVQMHPGGVLFRLEAPEATSAHVLGTFNGWGEGKGTDSAPSSACRMFGPDEHGVFEFFAPMPSGTHAFAFRIDEAVNIRGARGLSRIEQAFRGPDPKESIFCFQASEPPWPSYVPNHMMLPVVVPDPVTGRPALRVRHFARNAKSVHCVGNWDDWAGGASGIDDEEHRMASIRVRNVREFYIPAAEPGRIEYRFVVDARVRVADPAVADADSDGNSVVEIGGQGGMPKALFKARFDPYQQRQHTELRWGNALKWADYREDGLARVRAENRPMLWVITLPGSNPSRKFMEAVNRDAELVETLSDFVCMETPAHDVPEFVSQQKIERLPCVVLVDSGGKETGSPLFDPSVEALKKELAALE